MIATQFVRRFDERKVNNEQKIELLSQNHIEKHMKIKDLPVVGAK